MANDSDTLNGDVSSVDALQASPGPDGISLREAIAASNNSPGQETIEFAPALKGAVIKLYSSRIFEVLVLSGGGTTVNGDIDGDGNPDITLQPNRPDRDPGAAFFIASNNNTVNGLKFVDFRSEPFSFYVCPPGGPCGDRVLKGNRFLRNTIAGGHAGISVNPRSQGRFESDARIEDTLIAGNIISDVASSPIGVNPGVSGGSRNLVAGTIIVANRVSGGSPGISIIAGDTPSDYIGLPPDVRARRPVEYADSNVIRDTIISANIVEGQKFSGISVEAGIGGNQRNSVLCTKIIGNTVANLVGPGGQGIVVSASNQGGSRVTSKNLIADVEIRQNRITGVKWGMLIGPGGKLGAYSGEGVIDNRLEGVVVSENQVRDYQTDGILVWGGMTCGESTYTVSNNVLEGLTIRSNLLTGRGPNTPSVGIHLMSGWGCPGPVLGNRVNDVDISANTIRDNNVGIWLIGGLGSSAQNNRVSNVRLQENRMENTREPLPIANNEEGAINNQVEVSRQ